MPKSWCVMSCGFVIFDLDVDVDDKCQYYVYTIPVVSGDSSPFPAPLVMMMCGMVVAVVEKHGDAAGMVLHGRCDRSRSKICRIC